MVTPTVTEIFTERCLVADRDNNVGDVMVDEIGVSIWDGGQWVRFEEPTVSYWVEPISPNRRKRCEYCGTLHNRDYGVFDRCGAPL